jgi:RNA recognition motif-containing protein
VIVQGLSSNAFDGDLRELFSDCGNITNAKMMSRGDVKSKRLAFLKFSSRMSLAKALLKNGLMHMGKTIRVEEIRKHIVP